MRNLVFRWLAGIELVLLIIAIGIYFATRNANNFSGLAIVFPAFGMVIVGLAILILYIAGLGHEVAGHPRPTLSKVGTAIILTIVSIPIWATLGGSLGALYVYIFAVFLASLYFFILFNHKLGKQLWLYKVYLLSYIPLIGIVYYFDHNNTVPNFWLITSLVIFVIGLIKIFQKR